MESYMKVTLIKNVSIWVETNCRTVANGSMQLPILPVNYVFLLNCMINEIKLIKFPSENWSKIII